MFRRYIAPIAAVVTVLLVQMTIFSLSANDPSQQSESDRDYFIKPISQSNVVVVEPNYGRFFNPDKTIKKDESGEILYKALNELNENYDINRTQMVRFDRKGQIVPNLYVHVKKVNSDTNLNKQLPDDELLAQRTKRANS